MPVLSGASGTGIDPFAVIMEDSARLVIAYRLFSGQLPYNLNENTAAVEVLAKLVWPSFCETVQKALQRPVPI